MRGGSNTVEPLVYAPNQQQERTTVEQQRQPLHSPTTPAWGSVADKTIKNEPVGNKSDSSISSDYYTKSSISPSMQPSSTANCSSFTEDVIPQNLNAMQCNTLEYDPPFLYKDCNSVEEIVRHNTNEQQAAKTIDEVPIEPSNETIKFMQKTLQCPACTFIAADRSSFNEHLTSHCTSNDGKLDLIKSILAQLPIQTLQDENNCNSLPQQEQGEQTSEENEESGLRVPKVNSQGKVKTFRCKQCTYVAVTKLDFWDHSRCHIKAERLLTCPKCPFVTEYKHHLEYHLRNHFGSKPYRCEKCSYTCVNKSMLNSHLKSHSNVYQYRCANCSYATKYCHSLKLHLRKYSHQPAMVLNADGSPNPLPIIDVYGTRRGPKQKSVKMQNEQNQNTDTTANNNLPSNLESSLIVSPNLETSPIVLPQISSIAQHLAVTTMNGINATNEVNQNCINQNQPVMPFPYSHLLAAFPLTNNLLHEDATSHERTDCADPKALIECAKAINTEITAPEDLSSFSANDADKLDNSNNVNATSESSRVESTMSQLDTSENELVLGDMPLDLSKPEMTNNNHNIQEPKPNSPKPTGTSRRKGRAVKLERHLMEEDTDEEIPKEIQQSFDHLLASIPGLREQREEIENTTHRKNTSSTVTNEFTCQYCEISFSNIVMYTVHMGYHGYQDPYTCNMCGYKCIDKVSFFLHIARSKHS